MKKIFNLAVAALAAMAFVSCEKTPAVEPETPATAPKMEWDSNPSFEPVELASEMDVNIRVKAEAGIRTFVVKVDSPVLSPVISGITSDHTSDMDLIGDAQLASMLDNLTGGGIPTGDDLAGKTEVDFNISTLVPLILSLGPENGSDHKFTLDVSDMKGQSLSKTLTFHYTGKSTVTVSDIDLWNNTASVSFVAAENVKSPSVFFGRKGGEMLEIAAVDGRCTIAAEYVKSTNAAGLDVYSPKEGTGVYAGNTYVVELRDGGQVVASTEFATENGDVIPNGDMSGWSKKAMGEDTDGNPIYITYPNAEGDSFWDSGNNSFLETPDGSFKTPLCEEDSAESGVAALSARMVLDFIFAPGNLFTGDFVMAGMTGTANFGKIYDYTARPKALSFRYKANVGIVDKPGSSDPEKDEWKGKQDITRVFVAIVDWERQHGVTSGLGAPTGMWDPASSASFDEGAVLGYGELLISGDVTSMTDAELPIVWYSENAPKPESGKYSLVISCATSIRGDYLTGCSTNKLWVDDFKWVY